MNSITKALQQKYEEDRALRTLGAKIRAAHISKETVVLTPDEVATLQEYAVDLLFRPPAYDPNCDGDAPCQCGHPYYRHFDSYDNMAPVGCKYCACWDFKHGD